VCRWNTIVAAVLLAVAAGSLTVACQPSPPVASAGAVRPAQVEGGVVIHVASNGWHSGIMVARKDLPPGSIPETADFPDAAYFEFSWGEAEYFPAPRPTLGMAFGATFGANPAVLHLSGLPDHPRRVFPKAEVVELHLSPDGFRSLIGHLDATFARDGAQRAPVAAPGLHSFSRFYRATGQFNLLNTCNTWTARGLRAAGLPVEPAGVVRAEDLMAQLRRIAAG